MTHIYFDESHHERGGFTLGAFVVFDQDPSGAIRDAIQSVGLTPDVDEYKSRQPHATDSRWQDLRGALFRIVQSASIGLLVAPYTDRANLGVHVLDALGHILRENEIVDPITVYVDQGIFQSDRDLQQWLRDGRIPSRVELKPECDSRLVPGIQLADLVAHACSIVLLGRMGVADKTISTRDEGDFQLSFEMWARLRYNFLVREPTEPERKEAARAGMMDSRGALYVTPGCSPRVAETAYDRFGQTWLGCIH